MLPRPKKRRAAEEHRVLAKKNKRSVRTPSTEPTPIQFVQPEDQGSSHAVWLDALPQDICVRVAALVTRDRGASQPEFLNEDALALAQTSPKQSSSMVEALDHTPDLRYGDIKLWLDVFENPLYIDAREGRGNQVLHLLGRPSLRAAHISNRANHFTAISGGKSVVELSIHLERLTVARYTSMLEMLQKLSYLVSLSIICDPQHTCAFQAIIDGPNAYLRLREACPRVTSLHLRCHCGTEVDHSPLVKTFPSLKELTVAKPLPDAALPYMRSRESVILQSGLRPLCRYASKIGTSVTGIRFPEPKWSNDDFEESIYWTEPVNAEEVALLKNCPRLRELELVLSPGAEQELPEMKLLLSLRLHWKIKVRGRQESAWLGTPLDGSLVRRLCAQPLLQNLALVGAPVKMADLVAVLRATGKNLEKLTTSLTGQAETVTDRLLGIMDNVMRYNEKLQILRVVEPEWVAWRELKKCVSKVSIEKRKTFLPDFRGRVGRLQRKNPWFESATLAHSAQDVVTLCEEITN